MHSRVLEAWSTEYDENNALANLIKN